MSQSFHRYEMVDETHKNDMSFMWGARNDSALQCANRSRSRFPKHILRYLIVPVILFEVYLKVRTRLSFHVRRRRREKPCSPGIALGGPTHVS